jgi:hypothetical protein
MRGGVGTIGLRPAPSRFPLAPVWTRQQYADFRPSRPRLGTEKKRALKGAAQINAIRGALRVAGEAEGD